MRRFLFTLMFLASAACSAASANHPTSSNARHCLSDSECGGNESCLTWTEDSAPDATHSMRFHRWRDGICVSSNH